ncbi:MAG: hypothetical protein AB3N63_15390 [Puniceicoccaceae bacterium]
MERLTRPLILFVAVAALSFLVGILFPMGANAERLILFLGYASLALCTGIFLFSLRDYLPSSPREAISSIKGNLRPIGAIVLTGLWIISIEPYSFKIIFDELLISGTSQMMHLTRTPSVARSSNWSSGVFLTLDAFLDKRPFLLPFLTSLLHDISGYRLSNVFVVNTALLFGFLGFSFKWISSLLNRNSAYLFLILMAFAPVLAQGATSGNASVLNIFLLTFCLFLGMKYFKHPNKDTLVPLVYCVILLAQVRYESIVYILPFGLLILWGWQKSKSVILPPAVIAAPVFLVLNLIHIRYTLHASGFYWQDGPDARRNTFSLGYLGENLQSTFDFLLNIGQRYPNSAILSILGISGLFVVLFALLKQKFNTDQYNQLVLLLGLFIVNIGVVLFFNYGLFTVYATSRLSLPLQFFLALFAVFAFRQAPKQLVGIGVLIFVINCFIQTAAYEKQDWMVNGWIIGVLVPLVLVAGYFFYHKSEERSPALVASLLLLSLVIMAPKMHSKPYFHRYVSPQDMRYFNKFIQENKSEDTLFVTMYNYLAIQNFGNGLLPEEFVKAVKESPEAFESGHYQKIYLLHRTFPNKMNAAHLEMDHYMKFLPEFDLVLIDKQRTSPEVFVYVRELIYKGMPEESEVPVDAESE